MFDPLVPDELPPPAYELSQETFDQKTQQGIQASLEPQDPLQDLWEEWDEAKYEANARTLVNPSASSSSSAPVLPPATAHQYPQEKAPRLPSPPPPQQEEPAVRPLRIVKRSQDAAYKKAAEASSYQSDNPSNGPTSSSDGAASLSRSFSVLSVGRRTPPPMFDPVGPSYDGPEYEEEVTMSYVPGNSRPSSPVSVLSTDSYRPSALPPQPQLGNLRPNTNMGTLPPPQLPTQHRPPPRPTQTQPQRPLYQQQPRRRFNPMSAYNKSPFNLEPTPEKVDPSAFYNSAVSAHLSTVPQRSAITPTYRNNGMPQHELQHPRPHHAATFDSFASMNMGRERAMSVMSTDSSYYPNPPVNLTPNRGRGAFHPNR